MGGLNPYRQLSETISKKWAVTQGISRKLLPDFFQISQFRVMIWYQIKMWTWKNPDSGQNLDPYRWLTTLVMTQRLFRKLFSISAITRIFWISNFIWKLRFRKKFPENPLIHGRNRKNRLWKNFRKSSWVTTRFFSLQSALNLNVLIK